MHFAVTTNPVNPPKSIYIPKPLAEMITNTKKYKGTYYPSLNKKGPPKKRTFASNYFALILQIKHQTCCKHIAVIGSIISAHFICVGIQKQITIVKVERCIFIDGHL